MINFRAPLKTLIKGHFSISYQIQGKYCEMSATILPVGFLQLGEESDEESDSDTDDEIELEASFVQYVDNLDSGAMYKKRVLKYKNFCKEKDVSESNVQSLYDYLVHLREDLLFKGSTCWTNCSSICSWFEIVHKIKPIVGFPMIKRLLQNYERVDKTKQSKTLEKHEMTKFLSDAPNNDFYLVRKVATILSIYGLLRKAELIELNFEHVEQKTDVCEVTINRRKGKKKHATSSFFVTNSDHCGLIAYYISLFPCDQRTGRFLRKLNPKTMKGMKMNIGINTVAAFPSNIAKWLGKPNENEYTSHMFRRMAATFLAGSGASMPQIKAAGGWTSNTAPERYIAESCAIKRTIGELIDGGATPAKTGREEASVSASSSSSSSSAATTLNQTNIGNQYVIHSPASCSLQFAAGAIDGAVRPQMATHSSASGAVEERLVLKFPRNK